MLASNITMLKHRMNLNGNFAEQAMNCFHEINELYGGTINVVHHFIYSNNIISNECFTFKQEMKQEDKLPFLMLRKRKSLTKKREVIGR